MTLHRTELLCFACLPDGYSFAERIAAPLQSHALDRTARG
jgi:hypothetical protein